MDSDRRVRELGDLRHVAEKLYQALEHGGSESPLYEHEREVLQRLWSTLNDRAENMAEEVYR